MLSDFAFFAKRSGRPKRSATIAAKAIPDASTVRINVGFVSAKILPHSYALCNCTTAIPSFQARIRSPTFAAPKNLLPICADFTKEAAKRLGSSCWKPDFFSEFRAEIADYFYISIFFKHFKNRF